jgi:hypothetical protein
MKAPGPKRKGQHRWKGELAKPLLVGVALTNKDLERLATNEDLINEDLDNRLQQAIRESRIEKLALLIEHYKIADKTDYLSLALKLAIDHVPGFRIGRASELLKLEHPDYGKVLGNKRGRRREWTPERLDSLLSAIEQTKREYGVLKDREALTIIARRRAWSRPANHQGDSKQWIKTLENRLQEARQNRGLAAS